MGIVTAGAILDQVQKTLLDEGAGEYWTRAELLVTLNEALTAISGGRTDSYVQTAPFVPANGVIQMLPAQSLVLINITRNLGADGVTPGPAIFECDIDDMNRSRPGWTADPSALHVEHFMYDKRNRKIFYLWPPRAGGGSRIEVIYSGVPAVISEINPIPVDDTFRTPIYYFILGRAYEKNATRGDIAKSGNYYNLFNSALGIEIAAKDAIASEVEKA